jgi:transcriptional regulator with XRE-family HTH domain
LDRGEAELAPATTPTIRRWELGARLRKLRTEAGLTITDVAERLLSSPTKISRLETGDRAPQLRDVRDLCEIYGVAPATVTELMELARLARQSGWWQGYGLRPDTDTYVGLEASALKIHSWKPLVVPGLFQIEEYTNAVLRGLGSTWPEFDQEAVVRVREERQKRLLGSEGPEIWAIVDEAALRREVVPPDLMRAQLERLLTVADLPRVTLQVLPFSGGAHAGIQGPFVVLEFAPDIVGDVVYSEGLAGQFFFEKPDELKRYRRAFDLLRAAADGPERTQEVIRRLITSSS